MGIQYKKMVCNECEKKLGKLATPDVWKGKDSAARAPSRFSTKLSKKQYVACPYGSKCKICGSKIASNMHYCHSCSYAKGICSMCGKKILNVKHYKQSTV
eukprot:TRINITY_DN1854_c0_g1_i8.p2 TRINITY_DN1854_c0_g1~~TRINITY_DN1854_c0_g1_i8.p2  ORF type:complete len:100 (-),score=26.56 TRINITY_DN1854_c0_g1_i8:102-401(-)